MFSQRVQILAQRSAEEFGLEIRRISDDQNGNKDGYGRLVG